jgi:hypothetical protein
MSKLSESDIAKHAYHIWEREGRPHGRDKDHWHTAEREILGAATAQEDRPIGEIRGAQQASAQRSEKSENPPTDRQTGAAAPGRPAHPASPGITQAAAAAPKRMPQAQSEQPSRPSPQVQSGQPGATKPQQSASGRTPSPTPSSTRKSRSGGKQPDS